MYCTQYKLRKYTLKSISKQSGYNNAIICSLLLKHKHSIFLIMFFRIHFHPEPNKYVMQWRKQLLFPHTAAPSPCQSFPFFCDHLFPKKKLLLFQRMSHDTSDCAHTHCWHPGELGWYLPIMKPRGSKQKRSHRKSISEIHFSLNLSKVLHVGGDFFF